MEDEEFNKNLETILERLEQIDRGLRNYRREARDRNQEGYACPAEPRGYATQITRNE